MKKHLDMVLHWTPRILSIIMILFFSLFALDVFVKPYSPLEMAIAFIMHMIPSFVLVLLTIFSWKREPLGGVLFLLVAIGFTFFFSTYRNILTFLFVTGLPLTVGLLFLLEDHNKKKKKIERKLARQNKVKKKAKKKK